jgi:hypothetical protein
MPFPVIDRNRYWAYAGGITSLIVLSIKFSSSTRITTTFSQLTSVIAYSEMCSLSWLLTFLQMHTHHTANKYLKSTYLMSIVT